MSARFTVLDQPRVREGDRPLGKSFTVESNLYAYVTYLKQLISSNDHVDNNLISKSKLMVGKKKKEEDKYITAKKLIKIRSII